MSQAEETVSGMDQLKAHPSIPTVAEPHKRVSRHPR